MGYQPPPETESAGEQALEEFAASLGYPIVIVGAEGPESFLLNSKALEIVDQLALPADSWKVI